MVVTIILSFLLVLVMSAYIGAFATYLISSKIFPSKNTVPRIAALAGIFLLITAGGLCIAFALTMLFALVLGPLAVIPVIVLFMAAAAGVSITVLIRKIEARASC